MTTRQLAEKVTELYWPQADAFGVGGAPRALRPMVMRSWAAMVARLNELFLFGRERIALVPLRPALRDLQEGRCFYCGDRHHSIAWSRYRDDGLDNLVLAERGAPAEAVA